jgi:hypothetical protein
MTRSDEATMTTFRHETRSRRKLIPFGPRWYHLFHGRSSSTTDSTNMANADIDNGGELLLLSSRRLCLLLGEMSLSFTVWLNSLRKPSRQTLLCRRLMALMTREKFKNRGTLRASTTQRMAAVLECEAETTIANMLPELKSDNRLNDLVLSHRTALLFESLPC